MNSNRREHETARIETSDWLDQCARMNSPAMHSPLQITHHSWSWWWCTEPAARNHNHGTRAARSPFFWRMRQAAMFNLNSIGISICWSQVDVYLYNYFNSRLPLWRQKMIGALFWMSNSNTNGNVSLKLNFETCVGAHFHLQHEHIHMQHIDIQIQNRYINIYVVGYGHGYTHTTAKWMR